MTTINECEQMWLRRHRKSKEEIKRLQKQVETIRKKTISEVERMIEKLFSNKNWSNRNNQWMITVGDFRELEECLEKMKK